MKYHIREARVEGRYESLTVLPFVFGKKNYGLALRDGDPLLEMVNLALLSVRESTRWSRELATYIGK